MLYTDVIGPVLAFFKELIYKARRMGRFDLAVSATCGTMLP